MSASEWQAKMQRQTMRRAWAAKFTMANGRQPNADEYPEM